MTTRIQIMLRTLATAGIVALSPLPALGGAGAALPDRYGQAILVYSALMALDQANATGNYQVLREWAAPEFEAGTTTAGLAEAFAGYRRLNVALAPAVLYEPRLSTPAAIGADGALRLTGYMPTEPLRINFDMTFREVEGRWRLIGLAVTPAASRITQ